MISLEELFTSPRKSAKSYGEILPWFGMVSPGLVLCQDGSLLAGYSVEGVDVEGLEDFQSDQRIDQIQTAFRSLGDRITVTSVQERRFVSGYPSGQFSSRVANLIDKQWGEAFEGRRVARVTQEFYLSFNFPNQSEAFFEGIKAELQENDGRFLTALAAFTRKRLTEKGAVAKVRGRLAEMVIEFEQTLKAFSDIVETQLGFNRLESDHFLGALYARANFASHRGPVHVPNQLPYVNFLLAADSLVRKDDLFEFSGTAGKKYVAALSATGMPPEAYSEYMDQIMGVDAEYVLVQTFRFLDKQVAAASIQDIEMFYTSEVKSVATKVFERMTDSDTQKVNTGNLHLAQDAQDALVELTTSDISYGYFKLTMLALGDTAREANRASEIIASNLRANGFAILREKQGLLPAILGSMPGHVKATMRWKLASTANLADLAPIRTISQGEATHPLFSKLLDHEVPPLCRFNTQYGVTFDFNPHELDLGHTAIIGGAGSGKTSLMTLLISQFQKYSPSQTFIFDKDYSLMMATVLLGGKHIDLSGNAKSRPGMNPVRVMMQNGDDMKLRQWIEVVIVAGGNEVSSQEGQLIFTAIQSLRRTPQETWRLSAIYAYVAGVDKDLAAKLAAYVDLAEDDDATGGVGAFSSYFDNAVDNFELSNMVGMECSGILDSPQLSSPFMDYAFYVLERSLDGVTPTLIYIEEAWYPLSNPRFAAKVEDWLRTFRKKKAFVMFATQSLDEIARLPNIGSFVTNIPTQIFLPAVKSSVSQQADLFKSVWNTNDEQLAILARAIPKRDYLLIKPSVTRLVSTKMPPSILAINDATAQPAMREALLDWQARGGGDWQFKFLQEVLNVNV